MPHASGRTFSRVNLSIRVALACLLLSVVAAAARADSPADANAAPAHKITVPQAAVLGVVEGLTEYLPVSSTGHLILTSHAMGLSWFTEERGFWGRKVETAPGLDGFEIVIQLGAILAVLGLYRRRVGQMCLGLAGKDPAGLRLFLMLLVAFLPAAVVGLLLHKKIETYLFGPMPVIVALSVGGLLMIFIEHFFWTKRKDVRRTTRVNDVALWQALVIGLAQCLAMWPGTSRSMVTILAALVVGLDMVTAAEFSFLLALPTLGAATVYSGYKHWHELMASTGALGLIVGLVVSGIVAAVAVQAFVKWLTRHGMVPFGVYRIFAAIAIYWYFVN